MSARREPYMPARHRGVALLLVVWLIALLTALIGAFALTARVESMQGRLLAQGSVAHEIARAGLEYAMQRVADTDARTHWIPDGRTYDWQYADNKLQIQLMDESGKVDLNQADVQLLASLLRAVGVDESGAQQLAGAVVDWRDVDTLIQVSGGAEDPDYAAAGLPYGAKNAPFETVGEVEQVLGWTPELYEKVAAYLTVYAGRSSPDPAYAQGPVLIALGMDPASVLANRQGMLVDQTGLIQQWTGTYSVVSRAQLPGGRQAVLRAVVRAGGGILPGSAYTTLRWDEGWRGQ